LQQGLVLDDLISKIQEEHGITLLRSDARNLAEAYNAFTQENIVHIDRLETIAIQNREDIKRQEEELMRLSLEMAFEQTSLQEDVQNRIIKTLLTRLYKDDTFFDTPLVQKNNILRDNLRLTISRISHIRGNELQEIIENILNTLSDV